MSRSDIALGIKISIPALLFLLAGMSVLLVREFLSLIFLVGFATIGAALSSFLFLRRKTRKVAKEMSRYSDPLFQRRLKRVVSIAFFVSFSLSLLTLCPGSLVKPPLYYLFVSLCAGLIVVDIGLVKGKTDIQMSLAKSFFLSLNIFLSSQIVFPYGIGGSDSITHLRELIYPIVENGRIPSTGFGYANFPVHHILVGETSQLISIDPVIVYNILGGFGSALVVIIGFLLGRHLFDAKLGLFSALLFSGSSYVIYWSAHPSQLTFALPLFGLLLLIAFYLSDRKSLGYRILVPIMATSIIFCHPYTSIVVFIVLFSMWGIEKFSHLRRVGHKLSIQNVSIMFLAIMLGHWIYYSFLFETVVGYGNSYYLAIVSESLLAPPAVYDTYPLTLIFLNTIGVSIIVMMSVCGFLYIITRRTPKRALLLGYSMALIATAGVGLVLRFVYILPHRVFVFIEAFALIFLAAAGIRFIQLNCPERRFSFVRVLFPIPLIVFVFLFSSMSTIAGFETSQFTGDQPYVKLYETSHERWSAEWAGNNLRCEEGHHIYTGWSFSGFSKLHLLRSLGTDDVDLGEIPLSDANGADVDLIEDNSTILFSRFDIEIGFSSGQKVKGRFGQATLMRFDQEVLASFGLFDRIYDNGKIMGFQKN